MAHKRYVCADCGERDADFLLPEGRYLCAACWSALRTLRAYVVRESSQRVRARRGR